MARQLPRPEADLVFAAAYRPRQRLLAARVRASGIRRLAVARILDSARGGDRLQARSLPPRAARARALRPHEATDAPRAPVRLCASRDAAVVRRTDAGYGRLIAARANEANARLKRRSSR